jgi:phosphatidyl-myo-inositol dimannoside synthase
VVTANRPIKVLLTTPFYCPTVSGSARLLRDVVDRLGASGHMVTVLTYSSKSPDEDAAFDSRQSYKIHRIASSRLGRAPVGSLAMFVRTVALAVTDHYDLLLSGAAFSNAIVAHACSIATHTPLAVYAHGEDVTCVAESTTERSLLRWALRSARVVLANSKFTASCVQELGVPSEQVAWCPPVIDIEPYESVPAHHVEALRQRYALEGKRVILTVARLSERKGHDMVVRALKAVVKRVPSAHYLVVGKGDPGKLLALAAAEGVEDRLTIVPFVEDSDLAAVFALAEVYVMVSRMDPATREVEGFGIVYLEAAASGRPAVGARAGGAVDAIEDGVSGVLVDPDAPSEIAGALTSLLSSRDKSRAMGRAGRERVRRQFQKRDSLSRIERLLVRAAAARDAAVLAVLREYADYEDVVAASRP